MPSLRLSSRSVASAGSSSRIFSVTSSGARTSVVLTVAATVTILSGASTSLPRAVMVTVPLLAVAFAAKLRVLPLSVKSLAAAGATGVAVTVTVNASVHARVTVAVTRLTPPSSAIDCRLQHQRLPPAGSAPARPWKPAASLPAASCTAAASSTPAVGSP